MRLSVLPTIESKHLALELSIGTTHTDVAVKGTLGKAFSFVKYKWDEEKSASFSCMMQTEHTLALMNEATSLINCDINRHFPNLMNALNMPVSV